MRWTVDPQPKSGDERTRTFFAFIPFSIGNEVRWLEKVTVIEVYCPASDPYSLNYWRPKKFLPR